MPGLWSKTDMSSVSCGKPTCGDDKCITLVHCDSDLTYKNTTGTLLAAAQKSSRATVSFTERDHQRLSELAEAQDVSVAWVIRQAVTEYLERNRPDQPGLPLPGGRTG